MSRTLEPRIGGKRKALDEFLNSNKRKSYEDERAAWQEKESHNQFHNQQFERERERGRDRVDLPTKESVPYSSQSSSSSSSVTRGYSNAEKHSLSSAEIKLERMQKAALEKAEKVRKLVEEKASKIRKLAEEKANKLRCLADEKVSILQCPCYTHRILIQCEVSQGSVLLLSPLSPSLTSPLPLFSLSGRSVAEDRERES